MIDPDATINFHGAEVNLSQEYIEARKAMGLTTTDLDKLHSTVSHIYLNIPQELAAGEDEAMNWAEAYLALLDEIEWRQNMILQRELGLR